MGVSHSHHYSRDIARLSPAGETQLVDEVSALGNILSFAGHEDDQVASSLIAEFGSLASVFNASDEARLRVEGLSQKSSSYLSATKSFLEALLLSKIQKRDVIASADELIRYLRVSLAGKDEEELHVLFLNARNHLLRDEVIAKGSSTAVALRPRPILKRAFELNATALILVHNHPSGSASPSPEDVEGTRILKRSASDLEIVIHDHLIIAGNEWSSLRTTGLM